MIFKALTAALGAGEGSEVTCNNGEDYYIRMLSNSALNRLVHCSWKYEDEKVNF